MQLGEIALVSRLHTAATSIRSALALLLRGHMPAYDGDTSGMTQRERRRLELLPPRTLTTTCLFGRSIEITDPWWYVFMYREIIAEHAYLFRCDRKDPRIIDCGSNIGLSVIYLKHLYPDANVIAFEPDPQICDVLRRNIKVFDFSRVDIKNSAVWTREETLQFRADGSVGGRLCPTDPEQGTTEVVAERLYNYLNQHVDFLKVDIEGAELEVLDDCRENLRNVERLFVEFHGRSGLPQRLESLLALLRLAGFRYHIKDAYPIPHPFLSEERGRVYDLQLNIYAYRN